ncbi:MAG: hypothetical protein HP491_10350 [Nitrospira sp.]|nr:hypothetical protein [Nitrospira sp.]MBH0183222.1 hypothetical protein [Nitrospira sp.]MBH0186088.1 hypothetical protein [Nitrospira sp.]
MQKNSTTILSMMMGALAITAMVAAPAQAENSKKSHKTTPHSSAAATEINGMPDAVASSTNSHRDHKSGPAWKTIGGTVKQIKGDTYMVEDYEGNQVQLFVGQDTKHLRQKKVGDSVRAEITRGGFANSIQ